MWSGSGATAIRLRYPRARGVAFEGSGEVVGWLRGFRGGKIKAESIGRPAVVLGPSPGVITENDTPGIQLM